MVTTNFCIKEVSDELLFNDYTIAINLLTKIMRHELSKTDIYIFCKIISITNRDEYDNFSINQTKLSNLVSKKQSNISRTLKKLIIAQMIKKLANGNYQLLIIKPYSFLYQK